MLLLQGEDDGAKKPRPPAQAPASWRLRSRSSARTRRAKPSHAKNVKPACQSTCPPWTKSSSPRKSAPEAWRLMGEEVTEQLDYDPARFLRRRIISKKYVKRDEPHQAPIRPTSSPRSIPCKSAASPRPDCSHKSSSPSTAIIYHSTGRSRSTPRGTTSPSHAKAWHAGSGWPPIGCARFTNTSTRRHGRRVCAGG